MNMNEIATATRYNIPVIQVVLNNHVLGMVRQWQTLYYGKRQYFLRQNRRTCREIVNSTHYHVPTFLEYFIVSNLYHRRYRKWHHWAVGEKSIQRGSEVWKGQCHIVGVPGSTSSMPIEGAEKLVAFMKEFEEAHKA